MLDSFGIFFPCFGLGVNSGTFFLGSDIEIMKYEPVTEGKVGRE